MAVGTTYCNKCGVPIWAIPSCTGCGASVMGECTCCDICGLTVAPPASSDENSSQVKPSGANCRKCRGSLSVGSTHCDACGWFIGGQTDRTKPVTAGAMVGGLLLLALIIVFVQIKKPNQPMPPPDSGEAAATNQFLEGPGSSLVALDEMIHSLQGPAGSNLLGACDQVVTDLVRDVGDVQFVDLAAQTPDPVLRQLFLSEHAVLIKGLTACGSGEISNAEIEFKLLAEISDVVGRRRSGIDRSIKKP